MAKGRRKPKFDYGAPSDSLAKARALLRPRRKPCTPDDDALEKWTIDTFMAEKVRRLYIIADHYGIDLFSSNGAFYLAFMVADDFVPKFDPIPSQRGRPRRVTRDHLTLAIEVKTIIEKKNCSIANACDILSKRNGDWKGECPTSIEAKYHRFLDTHDEERRTIEAAIVQMRADNEAKAKRHATSLLRFGELITNGSHRATENSDEIS